MNKIEVWELKNQCNKKVSLMSAARDLLVSHSAVVHANAHSVHIHVYNFHRSGSLYVT
jgi:hypothetical protein